MKFCWSTLQVKDMEESLKFYNEILGLELNRKFKAGPDTEISFLGSGDTKIELVCNKKHPNVNAGEDISWGFEVASLDETILKLKENGIKIVAGPFQPNPSIRFIYILDPNGMKIQFVENL